MSMTRNQIRQRKERLARAVIRLCAVIALACMVAVALMRGQCAAMERGSDYSDAVDTLVIHENGSYLPSDFDPAAYREALERYDNENR